MNRWTKISIDFANQRNYLDELFAVYPTIPDGLRNIDEDLWRRVEQSFQQKDNAKLLKTLLKLGLFPIKDSYVAYLKRDENAIERNPKTINRLGGRNLNVRAMMQFWMQRMLRWRILRKRILIIQMIRVWISWRASMANM